MGRGNSARGGEWSLSLQIDAKEQELGGWKADTLWGLVIDFLSPHGGSEVHLGTAADN